MELLNFMSLGGMELIIVLFALLCPLALTIYSIVDILRSTFKDPNTKLLFLILVGIAPVVGSLIYFLIRRTYKVRPTHFDREISY